MNNLNIEKLNNKKISVIAPAKINLHLEVLGLRKDNFHELAMIMQSISLFDELSFSHRLDGIVSLSSSNTELSTNEDNLIVKAANLLKIINKDISFGVDIDLKKNIPIGAGLAGGSTDAAATLIALNKLWDLDLSLSELKEIASQLGSDVPFCLNGGMQFCFGRGEVLQPVNIDNPKIAVLLVKDPLASVSTPWAYKLFREINESKYLTKESEFEKKRNSLRHSDWIAEFKNDPSSFMPPLYNDLQQVVSPKVSSVQRTLKSLGKMPCALTYAMSGSGPSCFALYENISTLRIDLEENKSLFEDAGLNTWVCEFVDKGIAFQL